MNKENYDGLRKQLDNGSLDIPSQITILEIAYNLEQQLQAYKDKEDILLSDYDLLKREYIKLKQQKQDLKEWLEEEIEVGDYVNGEYMLEHYWYKQDIKEILTHEQYEANAFKVVE